MSLGQPLSNFDHFSNVKAWLIHSASAGRQWFLQGCFYEAHEAWELHWKSLPRVWRSEIQAWILVCGVHIHRANQRADAAQRLLSLALLRLQEADDLRKQQSGTRSLTCEDSLDALRGWVHDAIQSPKSHERLGLVPNFRLIEGLGLLSGVAQHVPGDDHP